MHKLKSLLSPALSVGFTMIELLIVIAILGILAVAVLSAINPVEQINRGRDTGSRSDAEQLLSAMDRFNAFQGYYPWQTGAGQATFDVTWFEFDDDPVWSDGGTPDCPIDEKLSVASTAGCTGTEELKISFFNRIFDTTYNHLYVYNRGTVGDSTYVCFAPRSKAFANEANDRVAGTLPADYPASAQDSADCATGSAATGNCICLP